MAISSCRHPPPSWLLAIASLPVVFACDTRKSTVKALCEQLAECQIPGGHDAGIFSDFVDPCKISVKALLDAELLDDVQVLGCQRCISRIQGGDRCDSAYVTHKCDQPCRGLDWVTGPQNRYTELEAACSQVVGACDVRLPAQPLPTSIQDITDGTPSSFTGTVDTPAISQRANRTPRESQIQCTYELLAYLWGNSFTIDGGSSKSSVGSSTGGESGAAPAEPIAIHTISAETLKDCQNCLASQDGDQSTCNSYGTACSAKCAAVPAIGKYLANPPGQRLCAVALETCRAYTAPKAKDMESCVSELHALESKEVEPDDAGPVGSESKLINCARYVETVGNDCARLLDRSSLSFYCQSSITARLFAASPAYQFCAETMLCGPEHVLPTESCLERLANYDTEFDTCLACLRQGQTDCATVQGGQSGQGGQAGLAGEFPQSTQAGQAGQGEKDHALETRPCDPLCQALQLRGGAGP